MTDEQLKMLHKVKCVTKQLINRKTCVIIVRFFVYYIEGKKCKHHK